MILSTINHNRRTVSIIRSSYQTASIDGQQSQNYSRVGPKQPLLTTSTGAYNRKWAMKRAMKAILTRTPVGGGGGGGEKGIHAISKPSKLLDRAPDMAKVERKETKEKDDVEESPPEKPLPGDCCGSGCVRCVWDVYYEELEDYNKRQKEKKRDRVVGKEDDDSSKPKSSSPSSSSLIDS